MASLLIVRRGVDIVAHCDAVCYDATQPECVCRACKRYEEDHGTLCQT